MVPVCLLVSTDLGGESVFPLQGHEGAALFPARFLGPTGAVRTSSPGALPHPLGQSAGEATACELTRIPPAPTHVHCQVGKGGKGGQVAHADNTQKEGRRGDRAW